MLTALERLKDLGTISSGYGIFVRCANLQRDDFLLDRLGIEGFAREAAPATSDRYVLVTNDSEWVHIFDDLYYTMWNSGIARNRIPNLAKDFDIFTFFAGDSDDSLSFSYFRDGTRRRHFVAEDPQYRGRAIIEDTGVHLDAETESFKKTDPLEIGRSLARSVGVDLRHQLDAVRIYTKPYKNTSRALVESTVTRRSGT